MEREALADRIVTYCDAMVAFAVVNGLAFLIALGEPDIRCSIVRVAGFVGPINLLFPVLLTAALVALRRFEQRLRGEAPRDELVARFWRVAATVRLVLIWVFSGLVLFGIAAATRDPACPGVAG